MIFTMAVPACVLLIQSGLVGGDPTQQFFSEMLVKAGQQVVLPCQSSTKESATNLNFFWYRQFPGDTLTFILQAHKTTGDGKYHSGRFSMVVYKNKTAPLEIAGVSLQDTAIYYCALRLGTLIDSLQFVSGFRLTVVSEVTPSPSVYRLTSKDAQGLEMCLITDYSPEQLTLSSAEQHTSAVVGVATAESSEESSYLSTYWARREQLHCAASHQGFGELEGEDPESGASAVCVTGLSLHFRTDEHLNTLSLSQLGLKIVLLKAVIFNVLMSVLVWKKNKD